MAKTCVGIDLGGTFIKFGLLDEQRRPGEVFQLPTPQDGLEALVDQMVEGARQAMERGAAGDGDVLAVGIGCPGPLSMSGGVVYDSPNIPFFKNTPLRQMISDRLGLPASLENDANAACLGEYLCGAGKECDDMVLLTLGTGVGGGVVVNGQVLHGAHEIGAELGHTLVEPGGRLCGCGQKGCLEQYGSATFMSRHAAEALEASDRPSSLREVLDANDELTSKDINEHRAAGDDFAAEVWDEMARFLAIGCVTYARILDPDRIVLAGGMAAAGDDLLGPVEKHYRAMHWTLTEPKTTIALATLGNDAGVIGAAGVAWQEHGQ